MNAFDVLGDPVRRRILELLSEGERSSGAVVEVIQKEFGITQAAVSQHLRVLRDNGFASVRVEGARRIYQVELEAFQEIDGWLQRFRPTWETHLDALAEEIRRAKKESPEKKERGAA